MIIQDMSRLPMAWIPVEYGQEYSKDVATIKTESGMRLVYCQLLPYEPEEGGEIEYQWTPIEYSKTVLDS